MVFPLTHFSDLPLIYKYKLNFVEYELSYELSSCLIKFFPFVSANIKTPKITPKTQTPQNMYITEYSPKLLTSIGNVFVVINAKRLIDTIQIVVPTSRI